MKSMRIAYFSTEYPPLVYGGLGVYADNISRSLVALGQKVEELKGYARLILETDDRNAVRALIQRDAADQHSFHFYILLYDCTFGIIKR